MARKRYKKKRADYRKGGRVQYAPGGRTARDRNRGRGFSNQAPNLGGGTDGQVARGQDRDTRNLNNNPQRVVGKIADIRPDPKPATPINRDLTRAATEEAIASTKIPDPSLTDSSIQGTVVQQQDRPAIQTAQVGPVTMDQAAVAAVSYTHLTLPTKRIV